jgi:FkbM family methyltransferase
MLQQNTVGYQQVKAIRVALWNRDVLLEIENTQTEKWATRVKESFQTDERTTQAITMPDLLEMINPPRDNILLKLDIEGAEQKLFDANYEQWLTKIPVIFMELHDGVLDGCSETFYRAMSHYHFKQFHRGESLILLLK